MVSDNSEKPEKIQDIELDSNDELYKENAFSGWQKNKRLGLFGDVIGSPFLWVGAGIIVLILILIIAWPKSDDQAMSARLDHMAQRLDTLENRIFIIETTSSQTAAIQLPQEQGQGQNIEPLQNRMEQLEAFLHHKTSQFSSELEKINKKLSSTQSKPASATVATKTPSAKKADSAKYHVVKQGETLYRISINYGVSVDRLLELNNLSKNSVIRPGQRIMVSR
ncbi:MAG: LysM domain-containing protein [Desulfobacterales bacterium]